VITPRVLSRRGAFPRPCGVAPLRGAFRGTCGAGLVIMPRTSLIRNSPFVTFVLFQFRGGAGWVVGRGDALERAYLVQGVAFRV